MYIYLCGGMRPDKDGVFWQDRVRQAVPPDENIVYLDPCKKRKGLGEKEDLPEFTAYDLFDAAKADIIFVYMEPSNPGGFMACVEIGYAMGIHGNRQIRIIVNQDPENSENPFYRYRRCINALGNPNKVYKTLDEGIVMLRRVVAQFRKNVDASEVLGEKPPSAE
ncbi:MAG: hypothetical protein A3H69_05890 [Candidatus Sungbacteria bacterium RIFCSPLOWO2_02_FULL_47_9]|nr:MAG: hypothetical protein A3H69_05890 [Candidatus Sungbacteria bacterium RIFCSPLOWO2_02_FULL_47_9]